MSPAPYPGDLLEHLRSFTVLSGYVQRRSGGAFARAAAELGVDVSVLRRRMQALAAWTGAPLVDGRGATMRLSATGERVRDLGVRALEAVEELAGSARAEDVGPLRVACTGTFLAEVLPSVLAAVRDRHPGLRLRVRREGATAAGELLARGEIDFAIVRATSAPGGGLASRRLGRDRLWLAAPAYGELARGGRPTLDAIARHPLVGYRGASSTMRRVMEILGPRGAAPWIEVDGKHAALRYVAAGLGVAFVSLLEDQRPAHPGVTVHDVTTHFRPVHFYLAWPRAPRLDGFRRTFHDALVAAC